MFNLRQNIYCFDQRLNCDLTCYFFQLTDQCPDGNAGPTCGLLPHDDLSSEIAEKFYPPPPTNRTDMADIDQIKAMFIDLNTTVQHVADVSI